MAKPNIRMVAERAQLSPATVSLALRGSASIPEETRARVLAAARELNYIPVQRGQRAPRPAIRQALFITKDFGDRPVTSNPFYGEVLSAAQQECAERGLRLLFTLLPEDASDDQQDALLSNQRPSGVLMVGAYPAQVVRGIVARASVPLVLVDNVVPGLGCDTVMADDFGGGWSATQHLLDLGHRRIAAIVSQHSSASFAARYRGYCAACDAAGVTPVPPSGVTWDRASLRAALGKIMGSIPRPTALFCATDMFAVFAMELLRDLGLRVPEDVSVVGFDNFPISQMAHPPLTTMNNHPQHLGRLGVQRLLARIDGDQTPAINLSVTTQLIVRESTCAR